MSSAPDVVGKHGNSYNIFILVLTIFSLVLMALLLLPLAETRPQGPAHRLRQPDLRRLPAGLRDEPRARASRSATYFIGARLARPPRVDPEPRASSSITRPPPARPPQPPRPDRRLLGGQAGKDLVIDVLANRGQYATFITILSPASCSSSRASSCSSSRVGSPDANITTGGDALWWGS